MDFAASQKIFAGAIVTCVGSLERYNLRFANQKTGNRSSGFFEILSLVGTFSATACHLHISLANEKGEQIGGHLLEGNEVYTTAEIILVEFPELEFHRSPDPTYGFYELDIRQR